MQNCGVEEFDDHMHSGTYGMVLARHGRDATPITTNAIIRGHQKPIGPVFSDVHLRPKATLFDGNVELNRYTSIRHSKSRACQRRRNEPHFNKFFGLLNNSVTAAEKMPIENKGKGEDC